MPTPMNVFRLFCSQTVVAGTPATALQYAASSTNTAEIVSFCVTQSGIQTSSNEEIAFIRKTGGATVTAATTGTGSTASLVALGAVATAPKCSIGTTATGINATSEGTNGNELYSMAFSDLAGAQYAFLPEERLWIPPSGILALRLNAKMAATWLVQLVVAEYG